MFLVKNAHDKFPRVQGDVLESACLVWPTVQNQDIQEKGSECVAFVLNQWLKLWLEITGKLFYFNLGHF